MSVAVETPTVNNNTVQEEPAQASEVKSQRSRKQQKQLKQTDTSKTSQQQPQASEASSKPRSQSRSSRRRKARREAAQRLQQQQLMSENVSDNAVNDTTENVSDVVTGNEVISDNPTEHTIDNDNHEIDAAKQSETVLNESINESNDDGHETVTADNNEDAVDDGENITALPGADSHEVCPGQDSCQVEANPEEETMGLSRKQPILSQDEGDKDTRDVASNCPQSSSGSEAVQTCVIPAPPPPPPPGYLQEGLKPDQNSELLEKISQHQQLPPKSCGTIRKNKQLSRKDVLISQLTEVDDSFALFLKSQLNISVDARERTGSEQAPSYSSHAETLNRKKKLLRRQRTESECSNTEVKTDVNSATVDKTTVQGEGEASTVAPQIVDIKTVDKNEFVEKDKQCEGSSVSSSVQDKTLVVKRQCASNARDRPLSIVDFESLSQPMTTETVITPPTQTQAAEDTTTNIVEPSSEASAEDQQPANQEDLQEKADKCLEKPDKGPCSDNIMTVAEEDQKTPDTSQDSADMGLGLSAQTREYVTKQNLSKSDSGYSGHDKSSDDTEEDHDGEEDHHTPAKSELTVDQAMRKYSRIVEKKTATETNPLSRTRVMSEGSEFSDESSDSDCEDVVDGKLQKRNMDVHEMLHSILELIAQSTKQIRVKRHIDF